MAVAAGLAAAASFLPGDKGDSIFLVIWGSAAIAFGVAWGKAADPDGSLQRGWEREAFLEEDASRRARAELAELEKSAREPRLGAKGRRRGL